MTSPTTPACREAARGIAAIAALTLVCSVFALAVPLFNMEVFNRVLTTRNTATLAALCAGLAIGLLIYAAIDHLRGAAMGVLAERIHRRLSVPLIEAVAAARAANPATALRDLETLRHFLETPVCVAPFELFWAPVLLVVLAALHPDYALLAGASAVVLCGMNVLGDAMARRHMLAASAEAVETVGFASAAVNAAEAVLAMGMLPALLARGADGPAAAAARRTLLRNRIVTSCMRALRMAMTGGMVALGLVLALQGDASPGSMVAANMILARMLLPFEQIAGTYRQWVEALAAWRRVRAALEDTPAARYTHALPAPAGPLVVDRVTYLPADAERPVLRGISFTLPAGESLGIIGPGGAGKSTLLRLILGIDAPSSGGVFLDGHSTFLWERADFASHVGYVPQSLAITEGSIAEVVARLARPDFAAAVAACRRTGVHDAVLALPHGYATPLRDAKLSAGERQRIALARALYANPRLLVLDEPSAFLDDSGEAMLNGVLRGLRDERVSVVVVTHRPAVIDVLDHVLVLRDGLVDRFGAREAVLRALQAPRIQLVRAEQQASA
jgi:ATP-binding cassette subfamily C protein